MANIVFITNSLSFGGAAKMLSFVANSLSDRGHNVCIINLKATGVKAEYQRAVSERIDVKVLPSVGRAGQITEMVKIAKDFSADVIIGFTQMPNAMAKMVGTMTGTPSIMSERGDPRRTGLGVGLKSWLLLRLINSSAGGVFQTKGAGEIYGKGLKKRAAVIPNPIFINEELPQVDHGEREKTVVSVARFDNHQKRYDVMLDAFKEFSSKHPEYILKLYGEGPDESRVRQWVEDRRLTDKVRFMGLTTKPMTDTCRDGMFLITSDYEGISNALLEAMAIGLPCVSTDHTPGGARLLITDHENGLLAPIGDAQAIARAMCEYAEDDELAKKCGDNARAVVDRFAPDKIIDKWEEYILKICKKA